MVSLRQELRALPVLCAPPLAFDVERAPGTPQELFVEWFRHAVAGDEPEPHAMTLYAVDPDEVEFWQADQERLHTRLRYSRVGSTWERSLRWP